MPTPIVARPRAPTASARRTRSARASAEAAVSRAARSASAVSSRSMATRSPSTVTASAGGGRWRTAVVMRKPYGGGVTESPAQGGPGSGTIRPVDDHAPSPQRLATVAEALEGLDLSLAEPGAEEARTEALRLIVDHLLPR